MNGNNEWSKMARKNDKNCHGTFTVTFIKRNINCIFVSHILTNFKGNDLFKKINSLSLSDSRSEISKSFDSENSSSESDDTENSDSDSVNTNSDFSTPENTNSESEYSVSSNSEKKSGNLSNRNRAKILRDKELKSTVIESSDSDQKCSASDLEKLKKKKKVSIKFGINQK
jgi:hypothetical protein